MEFALLGAEVSLAFLWNHRTTFRFCLFGLAFCSMVAITDELIQLFVPGRVASVFDVLIDAAGSACVLFIAFLLVAFLKRQRKNEADSIL